MKRTLNAESVKNIGKEIKVCGWVDSRRDHGGIVFLDLRDRTGLLQIVSSAKLSESIRNEYVLEVLGTVQERPEKMKNPNLETGSVELKASVIKILSQAHSLPFDLADLDLSLPTLLDNRPLVLRNEKIRAILKIEEGIVSAFRKSMESLDFTGFESPVIVPHNAEGGAEVFKIDYYGRNAYMAQSPQLYKQIMVTAFERVFTVNRVFRAEPSVTTRHLSEYVSLDAELGFIDSWEEIMDVCEKMFLDIFNELKKNCSKELKLLGAVLPEVRKIPRIKMREAQEIIFERTKRDNRKEPDLEPEDEKEICLWAKEKYGSEMVFITHYPVKKRPFYAQPDDKDPGYTLSFDLLFKGLEIVTGGQRINEYEKLLKNIKKWGNKPEQFSFYLQAFKYGMPPEGGFAVGLERVVKQVLGLSNVREASPFPRDMERIDERLSLGKKKAVRKKTSKKKK
jgi:nondiscriminating aspartyl-tRNA synthetase